MIKHGVRPDAAKDREPPTGGSGVDCIQDPDALTQEEFLRLKRGDAVQNVHSGEVYIITSDDPSGFTAVRSVRIMNRENWRKV